MSRHRRRKYQPSPPPLSPSGAAIPRRAIITPLVDLLCCGGLSFVGISLYLAWRLTQGQTTPGRFSLAEVTLIAALVNWPHFMASYRLLYSSRLQVARHKWASIGVPAFLLGLMAIALLTPSGSRPGAVFVNEPIGFGVMLASQTYLAWHYTGQAWGMVAAFAYLQGIRMDETERRMIRSGMRLLLVFHVFWASQDVGEYYGVGIPFEAVLQIVGALAFVTLLIGIAGFRRVARRTGQRPSLRMIAPWAALYAWYALLYLEPTALFWVQISHALQYMVFPIRVELNQHAPYRSSAAAALRGFVFYLLLVAVGMAVFYVPREWIAHGHPQNNLAALISAAVNIHHYFIDGVIWKIRNPEVQRTLFAHLESPQQRR